jgi:hypothetical protein
MRFRRLCEKSSNLIFLTLGHQKIAGNLDCSEILFTFAKFFAALWQRSSADEVWI